MTMVIPCNGRDTVAMLQSQLIQHIGETFGIATNFAPGRMGHAEISIF